HDAFTFRVFADGSGDHRPLDGPFADWTPHPTGKPDGTDPPFVAPVLVTIEGFNKNPMGAVDPWLAPGTTDSIGNNVDAYADRNAPDGLTNNDFRATITSANTFDRIYDLTLDPFALMNEQSKAGVTQLFYTTNW